MPVPNHPPSELHTRIQKRNMHRISNHRIAFQCCSRSVRKHLHIPHKREGKPFVIICTEYTTTVQSHDLEPSCFFITQKYDISIACLGQAASRGLVTKCPFFTKYDLSSISTRTLFYRKHLLTMSSSSALIISIVELSAPSKRLVSVETILEHYDRAARLLRIFSTSNLRSWNSYNNDFSC